MGSRELLARLPVGKLRVDLSSSNIATGAWTVLSSSWPAACTAISVAYTGKGILRLAKGAVGSEVDLPIYLTPGMNHDIVIPLELAKGLNISGRCLDQAVTSGELVINLYG